MISHFYDRWRNQCRRRLFLNRDYSMKEYRVPQSPRRTRISTAFLFAAKIGRRRAVTGP